MGPSYKTKLATWVLLLGVTVSLLPSVSESARDGVRDLQTRSGSLQEISFLMAEKNWRALSRLIYMDPSIQFSEALAHSLFRHPAEGPIYRLQIEMIERGSPELISAVAKTGFTAAWTSSDSLLGGATALELAQNILRTFPESASHDIQGLLFDTRFIQQLTDPMMLEFFTRASKDFLTSKTANAYFSYLIESGLLSKEQTRLIEFALRKGADIYDAGSSPSVRLKYLEAELAKSPSGGSCKALFAVP